MTTVRRVDWVLLLAVVLVLLTLFVSAEVTDGYPSPSAQPTQTDTAELER